MTFPFEKNKYNIYIIGRDKEIILHKVLDNKESENLLDRAILSKLKLKFKNIEIETEL